MKAATLFGNLEIVHHPLYARVKMLLAQKGGQTSESLDEQTYVSLERRTDFILPSIFYDGLQSGYRITLTEVNKPGRPTQTYTLLDDGFCQVSDHQETVDDQPAHGGDCFYVREEVSHPRCGIHAKLTDLMRRLEPLWRQIHEFDDRPRYVLILTAVV